MGELIRYLYNIGKYELHLLYIDDGKSNEINYPYVTTFLTSYQKINRQCSRWHTYKSLWRQLNEINPDIVHDWSGDRVGIYLLPRLFTKKFYYIAGYLADGNKDPLLHSLIYKAIYYFSDKIVSNSWAGIISHKAPKRKSIVIYNGFNPDRLPSIDHSNELRTKLGIGNNKVVSMVARITPEKDYLMFLNVALTVQQKRNDVTFLIIGQGKLEPTLKQYVNEKKINNVIFLGFRQDVIDLLKLSDVSLLCSNNNLHAEGVSNSIMESMACGTPVIATAGGGTAEIIKNKENGFIVSPHDHSSMSEILLDILDNKELHKTLSNACINTINEQFSITKMVNEYIKIYNEAQYKNK